MGGVHFLEFRMSSVTNFKIQDLGLIAYQEAYQLQKQVVKEVMDGGDSRILLCEHPPVITMGRMAKEEHILFSKMELNARGIDIEYIDRGGDITLHAPGQLVVYPIFNLTAYRRDLHWYLRCLEDIVIALLADFGIVGRREPGQTGVWVDNRKAVSMGIGVKRWVCFHGVGINVNTDLNLFSYIQPCGLNVEMTSISHIIGRSVEMDQVKAKFVHHFQRVFQSREE